MICLASASILLVTGKTKMNPYIFCLQLLLTLLNESFCMADILFSLNNSFGKGVQITVQINTVN